MLLFDGECGLCNRVVRMLLKWDRPGRLRFSALQGPAAQAFLRAQGLPTEDFDSIVFIPDWSSEAEARASSALMSSALGNKPAYRLKTDGVIAALRALDSGGARILATVISLFPSGFRDAGYRAIARWRYRFFGPWQPQPLAREEWRRRFIDPLPE